MHSQVHGNENSAYMSFGISSVRFIWFFVFTMLTITSFCLSGVQSSTPLSRSQAKKKEGWRQEGHPAVKEVLLNPQESSHVMNASSKTCLKVFKRLKT